MKRSETVKAVKPRYVELVRVSSAKQEKRATPENQRRDLDRLRKRRPGVLVERIEALAVSGAIPLEQTEAGRKLAALAKERAFDELRVWDIDRVLGSRASDPRDRFAVFGLCIDAGAILVDAEGEVIDPTDDEDERDYYERTYYAKRERLKIRRRTIAGRKRAAEDGRFVGAGRLPWWLGSKEGAVFAIPERVEAVIQMGNWLLEGASLAEICRRMDVTPLRPAQGKRWFVLTVRRLLSNPAVCKRHPQSVEI